MAQNFDDDAFGLYEAICQACDGHAMVNDLGLCETCDGKMDRDLIRMREWAYSASAFGCPEDKLEDLRSHVIEKYGEKLELLSDEQPRKKRSKKQKRKTKRKH